MTADNDLDLFSAAFDQAVGVVDETTVTPQEPAAPSTVTPQEPAAPSTVTPQEPAALETPTAPSTVTPQEPTALETPTAPSTVTPQEPAVLETLPQPDYAKRTVELLETLAQKATSPAKPEGVPAPAQADTSQGPTGDSGAELFTFTDEERATVDAYEKEWPEVSEAEELKTRRIVAQAVGALITRLRTELKPLVQGYQNTQASAHMNEIRAGHNDFDAVRPQVEEWIGKQPAGLRAAYTSIKDTGSSKDVIELVSLYKQLHGMTPQSSSAAPEITPVKDTKPAQKAAASLAVVDGKRSTVSPKGDGGKDDFDGTWEQITVGH